MSRRVLILLLGVSVLGCDDATTRVCFSTGGYCSLVFASNLDPEARAGEDQTVAAGAVVTLNGSHSHDPDGAIDDYAWVQTSGPAVAITSADSASPSFTAPQVAATTLLTFRLTVTDSKYNGGIEYKFNGPVLYGIASF